MRMIISRRILLLKLQEHRKFLSLNIEIGQISSYYARYKIKVQRISMSNRPTPLDLPDAVHGEVVVRFPPEPSGYLHIGHAKALLLNRHFADIYEGKLIIRFDDTNPEREEIEYEQSILEDLKLLCDKWDSISHTSDYFEKIHEYSVLLIKKGLAYADDTDVDKMRQERYNGTESAARSQTSEKALELFMEMTKGTEIGTKYCLRAKIDMSNVNKALRDPVIYRCIDKPHHRTGNKWKVYPTYDFCCPVVDSIEGVTHALRTVEYNDRNIQYQWFIKNLELRPVHVWCFSRINFVYTLLSKRKLKYIVQNKLVDGWDDPRFPTVKGLLRRGLSKEALKEFILQQGPSQNNLLLEWDKIWAINKKILEPVVVRHISLVSDNIVVAKIIDSDDVAESYEIKQLPRNKKKPELGTQPVAYSREIYIEYSDAASMTLGEEVTLMDWGNAIVKKIDIAHKEKVLEFTLNLQGDFKKTKKKLTWIAKAPDDVEDTLKSVNGTLVIYDHIITKKKLSDDDKIENFVNKNSKSTVEVICDANIKGLNLGNVIQFQKKGLFILDKKNSQNDQPHFTFIFIPTGKQTSFL